MSKYKLPEEELLEILNQAEIAVEYFFVDREFYCDSRATPEAKEKIENGLNQIKEQLQHKIVTMTEIENAVGDTSDEYCEGVIELFESKGFAVED